MKVASLSEIKHPTLLLDSSRAIRNIERMARKAGNAGIAFRPHFKTHQSAKIGEWFRARGVRAITVSSVCMGDYFASHGWTDITIAVPVNLRELDAIEALSQRVQSAGGPPLAVLVDSVDAVVALNGRVASDLRVWIKIDVGYGRVGILWSDQAAVNEVLLQINRAERLVFQGLLTHSGHTYHATSIHEIRGIYQETIDRLQQTRSSLKSSEIGRCALSIGDTPSCSVVDDLHGVDEIRPGNFVFHDLMQRALGVCEDDDIAVAVACPVIGVDQKQQKASIYGGAVHLSKESIREESGQLIYGCLMSGQGSPFGRLDRDAVLTAISQEHGTIRVGEQPGRQIRIGDLVLVAPVHSCLTASLYREYRTLDGETISRM